LLAKASALTNAAVPNGAVAVKVNKLVPTAEPVPDASKVIPNAQPCGYFMLT